MGHLSLVTLSLKYLNRLTKGSRYFGGCNIWLDSTCQVFLLHREQDFCNFCCKPSKIKFCIEEVSVGEIYNTLAKYPRGCIFIKCYRTQGWVELIRFHILFNYSLPPSPLYLCHSFSKSTPSIATYLTSDAHVNQSINEPIYISIYIFITLPLFSHTNTHTNTHWHD